MGILNRWREARGSVMRQEYKDIMTRMRNANEPARSSFLSNIDSTIEETVDFYSSASSKERKAFLKKMRNISRDMWGRGDWLSALGAGISCLNAESRFVPGEDADYVRRETDRLIKEAEATRISD